MVVPTVLATTASITARRGVWGMLARTKDLAGSGAFLELGCGHVALLRQPADELRPQFAPQRGVGRVGGQVAELVGVAVAVEELLAAGGGIHDVIPAAA